MQILVEVKPNSKQIKIEEIASNVFKIHLTAPATEGKANMQLIKVLADYFKVAKSLINIKSGTSSRSKIVVINNLP